jgi:hypothetical protein
LLIDNDARLLLGSGEITSADAVFAPRPGYGTMGRRLKLKANFLPINVNLDTNIFHYDVQVETRVFLSVALCHALVCCSSRILCLAMAAGLGRSRGAAGRQDAAAGSAASGAAELADQAGARQE